LSEPREAHFDEGTRIVKIAKSGTRTSIRPGAYQHTPRRERPHVLVVDDYVHTREMYAEFLSFIGFRVTSAANARAAIASARRATPSLVVMDLSLPDMAGWQAAKILRNDRRTCAVPIIAVTAYSRTHARDVALRSGCNVFLEKPIGPNALADEISALLGC
jgi:CheY-like chemotaxis protein